MAVSKMSAYEFRSCAWSWLEVLQKQYRWTTVVVNFLEIVLCRETLSLCESLSIAVQWQGESNNMARALS